jgi:hypothetical protein
LNSYIKTTYDYFYTLYDSLFFDLGYLASDTSSTSTHFPLGCLSLSLSFMIRE